jgi:hypothetical protein
MGGVGMSESMWTNFFIQIEKALNLKKKQKNNKI